ncbi:MAG: glycosyltransferase family 4 protein [Bacteroidales bacterium]
MKLAYDAKRITNNYTGLGNYSRFVVNNMAEQYPEDKLLLFSPDKAKPAMMELISKSNNMEFMLPRKNLNNIRKAIWRSRGMTNDILHAKPDLYHGLTNELPFSIKSIGVPTIVTIHDLIFLHYPQFYKFIDRKIYNYKFRRACEDSAHIVAVSECTKRDIINFYKIAPKKVSVIYQGCNSLFMQKSSTDQKAEVKKKFHLPSEFILSVGTIEERKNLLLTVRALKASKLDIKLVVIGRRKKYAKQVDTFIEQNRMQGQVLFLKDVEFEELPTIYQLSSLFVYPSLYEGFGIPIIEALHSEVPTIGASGSCLEEAGGEGAVYINPHNHGELAEKMKWILSNKQQAQNMIDKGLEHVQNFDHEKVTKEMRELYLQTCYHK